MKLKRFLRPAIIVLCFAVGLAAIPIGFGMRLLGFDFWSHGGAGLFHRAQMEAIVALVRNESIPPNSEREFFVADLATPTLKPWSASPFGDRVGHVWVKKSTTGQLVVVILTKAQGHAGSYGFAYADISLPPEPEDGSWFRVDVPGPLYLVQPTFKIDEHWWSVLNNLD